MECKSCHRITKKSRYLILLDMLVKNQQDSFNGSDNIAWLLKQEAKYTKTVDLPCFLKPQAH